MVRYLKRLKSSKFVRVKAFPMYGGIGVSAPSLHRESTDSLIHHYTLIPTSKKIAVCPIKKYTIATSGRVAGEREEILDYSCVV